MEPSSTELMKTFYEMFPYPNRPFFLFPNPKHHLSVHGGFAALLGSKNEHFCQEIRSHSFSKRKIHKRQLDLLKIFFQKDKKILLVGCGTDEPLLFKRLHPLNPIDCVDLSQKSIRLAKIKVFLNTLRDVFYFKFFSRKNIRFFARDALDFMRQNKDTYEYIQCFGVLHHQEKPYELLSAMRDHLAPEGRIRLMIYSFVGRRLERRIQGRFKHQFTRKGSSFFIRMEHFKLRVWQFFNLFFKREQSRYRFRYLGVRSSSIADAFLHPSDPGLSLEEMTSWFEILKLKILYCEAKIYNKGIVSGSGNAFDVWQEIMLADKKQDLLSNPVIILGHA